MLGSFLRQLPRYCIRHEYECRHAALMNGKFEPLKGSNPSISLFHTRTYRNTRMDQMEKDLKKVAPPA